MEWTSSKEWIIGTGVMVNKLQGVDTLVDFSRSLRDGVMLCGILNKMKPGCVDYNSNIVDADCDEFSCQKNISSFLHTCTEKFDISEEHLFSADDLYELSDFGKVLSALSVLSHTAEAIYMHCWIPFDISLSDDEMLDVFLEGSQLHEASPPRERICSVTFDFDQQDYPEQGRPEPPKRLFSAPFNDFDKGLNKGLQRVPSQRDHIVAEILQSEESYLNQLHILVGAYIPSLEIYLTEEEKEKIFLNIEDICLLHQSVYDNLRTQNDLNDNRIDFSVFTQYKKKFLAYAYYCTFLDESKSYIDRLSSTNPAFRKLVEDLNKEHNMRHASLGDFLSVCFQRILRYPLLLERLKKKATEEEKNLVKNWSHVEEALVAMKDVAAYIDEYSRDVNERRKVKEIQGCLQFNDDISSVPTAVVRIGTLSLTPCDYLGRCEARLLGRPMWNGKIEIRYQEKKEWKSHFAFLFEHMLIICKVKGKTYQVREELKLKTISLERVDFTSFRDQISGKIYTIHINNKSTERAWMASFGKCMNIIREVKTKCKTTNHMHVFKLTTFDETDYECCGVCGLLLLGLIDQGYLCEECQLRVHEHCI